MISQKQKVLIFIGRYKSITAVEAVNHLGVYRLASYIRTLRKEGYNVISTPIDKAGAGQPCVRYTIGSSPVLSDKFRNTPQSAREPTFISA